MAAHSPPKLDTRSLLPAPSHNTDPRSGAGTPTAELTPTSARSRGINFLSRRHDINTEHDGGHGHNDDDDWGAVTGSWWGGRSKQISRPWHNPPKRRKTIPENQTVAYERTKEAVAKATHAIFDVASDVGHEVLSITTDVLRYAPVAGLSEATRVLLNIWDAVTAVETNRLSCLRLTERCATILYSVRAEVEAAGPDVADTLRDPIIKLTESFRQVEYFIQKQVSRPFLKRYLKRDEDARKIWACDAALTDSVGLFSVAIQIRMLKEIQAVHVQEISGPAVPTPFPAATLNPAPRDILGAIATIRAAQAAHDAALDTADLYAAIRGALRLGSDMAMLDLLQIKRGDMLEAMKTLQRALEDPQLASPSRLAPTLALPAPPSALGLTITTPSPTTPSPSPVSPLSAWDADQDSAFHREFLETSIDALRRMSVGQGGTTTLPPWTITRWEVDREERIGVGAWSDVFKGVWRGRQVAIKILAPTTPRKLFQHETAIWTQLKHPHVLELLGASSAAGDPPWFFVSPYMRNGTLVTYLKPAGAGEAVGMGEMVGMMGEVAVGMAYLHQKGVLHGDLKANNVLIDDDLHCVISDFGQSELKSEVLRLSDSPQPHGALRWQAPEILRGRTHLTPAADVYAFAIVCFEILTRGGVPWDSFDDAAVVRIVQEGTRPELPGGTPGGVKGVVERCWAGELEERMEFKEVATELGRMGAQVATKFATGRRGSPRMGTTRGSKTPSLSSGSRTRRVNEAKHHKASPDLAPSAALLNDSRSGSGGGETAAVAAVTLPLQRVVTPATASKTGDNHKDIAHERVHGDEDEARAPTPRSSSSVFTTTGEDDSMSSPSDMERDEAMVWDGYESPPPRDERVAVRRNERRYRLLLQHDFNPSLNLPLWTPTPVRVGAVGYLSKPHGTFVTFFNAYDPGAARAETGLVLPSIHGYGKVREEVMFQRRTVTQRGMDYIIQGFMTFRRAGVGGSTFSRPVTRRHTFPLRAGHRHAYLYTENTAYRYMINMDAAKAWFKECVGKIVRVYGPRYNITREDVYLVVGTLEARDWGLFVSHEHPDGQVHFNVYGDRHEGQEWGSFSTDTVLAPTMPGPVDGEGRNASSVHASRISTDSGAGGTGDDVVLVARLRFKPDVDEPTRL